MRKALAGAAGVLFAWAAIVAVTGGIDARILGIVIRSREPSRALLAGVLLVLVQGWLFPRELARDLDRAVAFARARAAAVVLLLAAAAAAHGVAFGTFSVGGSDAYGYVNQAYDWYDGALPRPIPLSERLPFDASDRLQAPLGYREGPDRQTLVPTYAPGLPLVMAAALASAGACGPFLVTPLCAALFVWLTFALGRRAGDPLAGLIAAFLIAVSPVVLYQTVWPMSDVPAGAVWTGAAIAALGARDRHAAAAGLLAALGLLIRPNLLPVAAILAAAIAQHGPHRVRLARLTWFGVPVGAAVVFTGWLNDLWFGSPVSSGYGAAAELYSWANVVPNLKLNAGWMWTAQSPLVLLALFPLVPRFRRSLDARTLLLCAALFAATLACYVAYAQFEVWWYLRFLLPAFGALMLLMSAGLVGVARAVPKPFGALGGALALGMIAASGVSFASREGVFGGIRGSEGRYAVIGSFAATLPDNAALIAVQHSGSLRFHSGRRIVRFDVLEYPESQALVAALERAGHHPFLVVDDAEVADVRARFGVPADAPLPWPVRARLRDFGGVTVYDMSSSRPSDAPIALVPPHGRRCVTRAAFR